MTRWQSRFFESASELCAFLAELTTAQSSAAKIMPGRMDGFSIYGWDVFYPSSTSTE